MYNLLHLQIHNKDNSHISKGYKMNPEKFHIISNSPFPLPPYPTPIKIGYLPKCGVKVIFLAFLERV